MKTLIAASALTLLAGAAFAGEGQGDPFPYQAPVQAYSLQQYKQVPGASQNPYPFAVPGAASTADVVQPVGSVGEVQSANSLPAGFENGTAVAQSTLNAAPAPTRLAQPTGPLRNTHG